MVPSVGTTRNLIQVALGLTASFLLLNYALSPAHAVSPDSIGGFLFPRHGQFSASVFFMNWAASAGAVAGLLVINAAIVGTGLSARRLLKLDTGPLFTWCIGLAPSGLALLGGGLCGLFGKTLMLSWIAAGIISFFLDPAAFRNLLSRLRPEQGWARPAPGLLLALSPCLLGLPAALAPEIGFDAMRYHQALPAIYLEAHRVFHVERFLFCSFPSLLEMLYASAQAIASPVTAKLLNWQFLPLTTVLLWRSLAGRLAPVPAALVCASLAAMPFLASLAAFAGVDMGLMAVEFAALLAVLGALKRGTSSGFRVAGWLIGTAFGIKYLGVFGAAGILFALLMADRRRIPSYVIQALPFVVVLTIPWRFKSLLMTGDPMYPYLGPLFGFFDIEPGTLERHLAYAGDWRDRFPFPIAWLKLFGVSLVQGIYVRHGEALAPLLFFVPAAIAGARFVSGRRFEAQEKFLIAACAFFYIVWAHAGGGIFRFLVPLFPAGLLLAGRLLPRLELPTPSLIAGLVLALLFQVPILMTAQYYQADPAERFWGHERNLDYIHRIVPPAGRHLPALEKGAIGTRRHKGPEKKLFLSGEVQAFYCPVPAITQFEFATPLLHKLARESTGPERMRIRLRQRGAAAILYRVDGMFSVQKMSQSVPGPAAAGRLQEFWRDYVSPRWAEDYPAEGCFYQGYALRDSPGVFAPAASALRFALPGLEHLCREIDVSLDAGENHDAFELAQELVRARPELAQAWLRLYLAARALNRTSDVDRATNALTRLGYSALIR